MPTYDYACSKCGQTFEIQQSMKDAPLRKCPKCGKPALKRLVGAGAGLIFKGTGFYITDYKNKPRTTEGGSTTLTDKKPTTEKPAAPAAKPATSPGKPVA